MKFAPSLVIVFSALIVLGSSMPSNAYLGTQQEGFFISTVSQPAGGGNIYCNPNPVQSGQAAICTITPSPGYFLWDVEGCGGEFDPFSVETQYIYHTGVITGPCTITATFVEGATIKGRVVDLKSNPLIGIHVHADRLESGEIINTVLSDAQGYYTITVLPGCYTIQANSMDMYAYTFRSSSISNIIHVGPGETKEIGDLLLPIGDNTVTGKIYSDSNPVTCTYEICGWVTAITEEDLWTISSPVANDGSYTLTNVPDGPWFVTVAGLENLAPVEQYHDIQSDKTVIFYTNQGGTIKGKVHGLMSELPPEPGKSFYHTIVCGRRFKGASALVQEDGSYEIKNVPEGYCWLTLIPSEAPDIIAPDFPLFVEKGKVSNAPDITVTKGFPVNGRVVDKDKNPIIGASVSYDGREGIKETYTCKDGHYQLFLPKGIHAIYLTESWTQASNATAYPVTVTVTGNGTLQAPDIILYDINSGYKIKGAVQIEGQTYDFGKLRIGLVPSEELLWEDPSLSLELSPVIDAPIQDNNSFELAPVPPGDYELFIAYSDEDVLENITILASQKIQVDKDIDSISFNVSLTGATVSGTFYWPDGKPVVGGTVNIFREEGFQLVAIADTDKDGKFNIPFIKPGKYLILFMHSSTPEVISKDFEVNQGAVNVDLGDFNIPQQYQFKIVSTPKASVILGLEYVYKPLTNGYPVGYTLVGNYPTGMQVDTITGKITYTPKNIEEVGSYNFSIKAFDQFGNEAQQTIDLKVKSEFVFISTPPTSVDENSVLSYEPKTSIPASSYTLTGQYPAGLQIDPQTGKIYYSPTEDSEQGTYTFTIIAFDEDGNQASQQIQLTVVPKNDHPVIDALFSPAYAMVGNVYTAVFQIWDEETSCSGIQVYSDTANVELAYKDCEVMISWLPTLTDLQTSVRPKLTAQDGTGGTKSHVLDVEVLPPLVLSPSKTAMITTSQGPVTKTFSVNGGKPGYTITVLSTGGDIVYETVADEKGGFVLSSLETGAGNFKLKVTDAASFETWGDLKVTEAQVSPILTSTVTNPNLSQNINIPTGSYTGATIAIPSSATSSPYTLAVNLVTQGAPPLPGVPIKGDIIEISAKGQWGDLTFVQPVEVTLPYSALGGSPDPGKLRVYVYDEEAMRWVPVKDYEVDPINKTISFKTYSFSLFTIMEAMEFKTQVLGGTNVEDFKMISFPCYMDDESITSSLKSSLGTYTDTLWRAFAWDHETQDYMEANKIGFDDKHSLIPAKSFWIISRYSKELKVTGLPVSPSEGFEHIINPGWNMVGNPFNQDISLNNFNITVSKDGINWENILDSGLIEPYIWRFKPQFDTDGTLKQWYEKLSLSSVVLKPYEGFWLYNRHTAKVNIRMQAKTYSSSSWGITRLARNLGFQTETLFSLFTSTAYAQSSSGLTPPAPPMLPGSSPTSLGTKPGGGGGCFIATAAYGSSIAAEVLILKEFRDKVLIKTRWGKAFVEVYYKYSPHLASFISENGYLRPIARALILPMAGMAWVAMYCPWVFVVLFTGIVTVFVFLTKDRRRPLR